MAKYLVGIWLFLVVVHFKRASFFVVNLFSEEIQERNNLRNSDCIIYLPRAVLTGVGMDKRQRQVTFEKIV